MEDNKPVSAVEGIAPSAEAPKMPQLAKDPETDRRFAELARKEKAIRHQARQLQDQRKAWEESQRPKPPPPPSMDDFKSKLLEDPTSLGLSYDQLAQLVLNQGNPQDTAYRQLQREVMALKAEQESSRKAAIEAQDANYKQALKQVERDVRKAVDSNKDFETIKASGQIDAVVGLIEQTFKEDGVLLGVEEAARVVEEELLEHAVSLAKLEKVRAKLTPTQVGAQTEAGAVPKVAEVSSEISDILKQAQEAKKRRLTITNRLQADSTMPVRSSEKDRIARAIAAAQGK